MAKLLPRTPLTVDAIFAAIKAADGDWRRDHLGASIIGRECTRQIWYSFRWARASDFDGRLLRLFRRGHLEEPALVGDLRRAGIEVICEDPEAEGRQIVIRLTPHFGGSLDGMALGLLEAPKTWHLLEFKTSNDKQFKKLQREGVRKAKPEHYAQMQSYMRGKGLKRAAYFCVNKNDDHIYYERVQYDPREADAIVAKADLITYASEPLERISNDPTWWTCKFCDYRPICHLGEVEQLERNCRTCLSSTPMRDGTWRCDHFEKALSSEEQRSGCGSHLFIPALLAPWEAVAVDEQERRITYRRPDGGTTIDVNNDLAVKP